MFWFANTFFKTYFTSFKILLSLEVSFRMKHHYSFKASILACCFAGFAGAEVHDVRRRSGSLGIMSALYDLVSDYKDYDARIWEKVKKVQEDLLNPEASDLLDDLLARKKHKQISNFGLDRGIDALKIIYTEFEDHASLSNEVKLKEFGTWAQISDDLIDYEDDKLSDHLNYLKEEDALRLTEWFLAKDYKKWIAGNPRVFVLRFAFTRAEKIAHRYIRTRR